MCISVSKCCFCVSLNLGTKIIGIVSTLVSLCSVCLYGTSVALGPGLPPGRLFFYAAMAVTAFVQCLCGCLLTYGAFTHRPSFMLPWSLVSGSVGTVLLVLTVAGTVLLSFNRKVDTTAQVSAVISAYFVYAMILMYLSSVVSSRRHEMMVEARSAAAQALMRSRHQAPSDYLA